MVELETALAASGISALLVGGGTYVAQQYGITDPVIAAAAATFIIGFVGMTTYGD